MAKLKLPEQLKSWKVLSALPSNSGYPVYRITRVEFDGSKSFAALTVVTFEGKDYNSDNVELITEEASFVKTVVKLRGVSRYIDAVVDNKPTKETITLWLLARDLPTISEKLGGKAPTDSEIVDFGLQLSETLDKLEQNNILHGNLKPENIFVAEDGRCLLGGFTAFDNNAADLSFTAPEMVGNARPDYTTDLYSLGLMMYTMANGGRLPFENDGDKNAAIQKRLSKAPVSAPAGGSEKLKSVIVIACQPENKNRWKNAGNIKNALASIKAEMPSQAQPNKNVIVPESTDFASNVFEENAFDEIEEAPAPRREEPKAPVIPAAAAAVTTAAAASAVSDAVQPEAPVAPEIPEQPVATAVPEIPEQPAATAAPEIPEQPAATVVPEIPEQPAATVVPEIPEQPAAPAVPEISEQPAAPVAPEVPVADEHEIDNRVFDNYIPETKIYRFNDAIKSGEKDYGDFFDEDPIEEKPKTAAPVADIPPVAPEKFNDNAFYSTEAPDEEPEPEKEKTNKRIVPIILIVAAVLLAAAAYGVFAYQNGFFPFQKKTAAPAAATVDEAQATEPTVPSAAPATTPAVTVPSTAPTEPDATEPVNPDPEYPIDVIGYFYDMATQTLEGQGFAVVRNYEYNNDVAEGIVFAMSPDSSELLEKGSTITLTVSYGPEHGSSDSSSSDNSSDSSDSSDSNEGGESSESGNDSESSREESSGVTDTAVNSAPSAQPAAAPAPSSGSSVNTASSSKTSDSTAAAADSSKSSSSSTSKTNGTSGTSSTNKTNNTSNTSSTSSANKTNNTSNSSRMRVSSDSNETATNFIPYANNTSYLTKEQVNAMSREELNIALNEIYARRGRIFTSEKLSAYFNAQPWYKPMYTAEEFVQNIVFNDYESKNVDLIRKVQVEKGYF